MDENQSLIPPFEITRRALIETGATAVALSALPRAALAATACAGAQAPAYTGAPGDYIAVRDTTGATLRGKAAISSIGTVSENCTPGTQVEIGLKVPRISEGASGFGSKVS